jgi:hypothetical protein
MAVRPADGWEWDAWHQPRFGAHHPYASNVPEARASDRRSIPNLGVRAGRGGVARDVTRVARLGRLQPNF